MDKLIKLVKELCPESDRLPFGIISASKEQRIFAYPVIKPSLAVVLEGEKKVTVKGGDAIDVTSGKFIFMPNNTMFDMRHKPFGCSFLAVLIEFDFEDFDGFNMADNVLKLNEKCNERSRYLFGEVPELFEKTLMQFVEFAAYSPINLWHIRKKEVLYSLYESGFDAVSNMASADTLISRVNKIVSKDLAKDVKVDDICSQLLMSQSTLRRRLNFEGTNINEIKRRAKLNHSLMLIQTTDFPLGKVAENCGYSSQSRFTAIFKGHFGMTPSELRKTRSF